MNMRLRILLLAIAAITVTGCRTDIGGVTSINEANDVSNDVSVSFRKIDDQRHLIPDFNSNRKRQLPRKLSELEIRLQPEYIGLTVKEARSLAQRQGRIFRLGDGPVTADSVPGRITARTKDGIVQSISVESYN